MVAAGAGERTVSDHSHGKGPRCRRLSVSPQRLSAAPLCSHAGGAPVLAVPAPRAWHTRQGGRHQRRVEEKAV